MKGSECVISIQELLGLINEFLYSNILIALLVATGVYFTIRTKFVQFRMLPEGIRLLKEKSHHDDGVSSFQALMISTASRVGTVILLVLLQLWLLVELVLFFGCG